VKRKKVMEENKQLDERGLKERKVAIPPVLSSGRGKRMYR
jgi:hypothetical protein